MNYSKAWEMLKVTANKETLEQMIQIEDELNKPKKEELPKVEFDIFTERTKEELEEDLNKFNLDEIRSIAKQHYYSWTQYRNKKKEYVVKNLAARIYNMAHHGDCFRGCSEKENK